MSLEGQDDADFDMKEDYSEKETSQQRIIRPTDPNEQNWSSNVRWTVSRAEIDWDLFKETGFLLVLHEWLKRVNGEIIEETIALIIFPDNRKIMATGSKKRQLRNDEQILYSQVRKKMSWKLIAREY